MIIECINCNKKFNVDSDLIPSTGRTVQCGSCNHVWLFDKKNTENTVKNKIEKKSRITPKSNKVKNFEQNSMHWKDLFKKKPGKKPSNFSKPLAKIKKGRVLNVQKCNEEWCKIKSENFSGWIKINNIWGTIN